MASSWSEITSGLRATDYTYKVVRFLTDKAEECSSFWAITFQFQKGVTNTSRTPLLPCGIDEGRDQPKMFSGANSAMRIDYGEGSAAASISNEIEPHKVKRPIGVGGMGTVDLV